jgi:hypothetical protein
VCWKPCSSCWSFYLLREEFLSAPIHSPPSGSPYRSFNVLYLSRSGFEGGCTGTSHFGHRPYADSRVQLMEGRRMRSCRCGDVLSSRAPTTHGMVLQCSGWWHNGGDGRTGPVVTEETRSNGLTSRRRPVRARGRRPYPFRGFRRPLSRGAAYGSGRHSGTELTPAFPHSSPTVPEMASRGGLAE